jgi:hypothetical protein
MINYESIFTSVTQEDINDMEKQNNLEDVINDILTEGSSILTVDNSLKDSLKINLFYTSNNKVYLIIDESNILDIDEEINIITTDINCENDCLCINCRDEFLEMTKLLCPINCHCVNCLDERLFV